ncbi:MAG: phosphate ABC transporter substrate-binding/OmpA family protein [Planctomycetota bacterium]
MNTRSKPLPLLALCVLALFAFRTATCHAAAAAEFAVTQNEVPKMPAAGVYEFKNNTVDMELSEYAGYAGVIAANHGLAANEDSIFFKKYGFKLNIALSEEESRPALTAGKLAALATTTDVLPVFGKQFKISVPLLISFSRGGDGVVVRSSIKRINELKGKVLVAAQFTESDFFIRYLVGEAGLHVAMLPKIDATPNPDAVNLIFTADAFGAGDLFLNDIKSGANKLAGCVTWDPKTTEVAQQSAGQAHILITNRNLLIVADILTLNKGFAMQNPAIVEGLVSGWMEGNRMVQQDPATQLPTIAKAFKWDMDKAKSEMAKVHLSNLPENLAFFSGAMDAAGSYSGIYQSALDAYGSEMIKNPVDSDYFLDLKALKAIEKSGVYKDQKVSIAPIRSNAGTPVEKDPLLNKDIRFYFNPNSAELDLKKTENLKYLDDIKKLLAVSPGSTVLIRGHVDNTYIDEFRKTGGEEFVKKMALAAKELSKNRAKEIKRLVVERCNADPERLDIFGCGWDEPVSKSPAESQLNRRVEIQWFMVE